MKTLLKIVIISFVLHLLSFSFLNAQNKGENIAIEVFKFNVELFPESWNAFDSLAEAYMHAGNRELATKNYEESLELNSQNTNGVEQLKVLRAK